MAVLSSSGAWRAAPLPPWARQAAWTAAPWLLPVLLLALWHAGASQGWISPQVPPPPAYVRETLRDLAVNGDLWLNTAASLRRVLAGFAAGGLLGLLLGVAMGLSRRLEAYLLPTFNALVQIPVLAWLPFVLLLVGIGEALKIILIAKAALVPVTLNTLQGFRQPARRCARWVASMATRVVRKCWRSCCRWPRPRCSPACGWASPRPGCRWWWWSWWPPAKAWAT